MAAPARSRARPAPAEPRRASRATLPQRVALKPSPGRRPGGPARPASRSAPPRVRRLRAKSRRRLPGLGGRAVRPALLVDRLLRGRVWVVLIAVLLAGIVFLNVALLEVNGSIARMDTRAADLARENSALRMRVARLGSSERIQREAAGRGFVAAAPGRVTYLDAGRGDAVAAARALERWPEPQRPANSPSATAAPGGSAAEAAPATGASGDSPSGAGVASDADTSSTGDSRTEPPASQSSPDDEVGAASP